MTERYRPCSPTYRVLWGSNICMFYIWICNYIDLYIRITKNLILFILTNICMITTWFFSFSHTFAWLQTWIFTNVSISTHCSNCLENSCSNLIVYVKIKVAYWILPKNQVASWMLPKNQVLKLEYYVKIKLYRKCYVRIKLHILLNAT